LCPKKKKRRVRTKEKVNHWLHRLETGLASGLAYTAQFWGTLVGALTETLEWPHWLLTGRWCGARLREQRICSRPAPLGRSQHDFSSSFNRMGVEDRLVCVLPMVVEELGWSLFLFSFLL